MLSLEHVTKDYETRNGRVRVLNDVSFTLQRGRNLGILGRNGAGKSTLIRLISGAERPTAGRIHRGMRVSWPLAFGGAFHTHLTGLDNLKFVCRIYGIDYKPLIPQVEEFTELGDFFREPVSHYSSGMMARLAFALSMAVEFDCFLIDEAMVVGDARFHERCHYELFHKRKDRAFIMVNHNADAIRTYCESAVVLHEGRLLSFPSVDTAYEFYLETFARKPTEMDRASTVLTTLGAVHKPHTECDVCGRNAAFFDVVDFTKNYSADSKGLARPGVPVAYYQCENCEFTFTDLMEGWSPAEIDQFLRGDAPAGADAARGGPSPAEEAALDDGARHTAATMSRWLAGCEGLRVLSYGPGSRHLADALAQRGFSRTLSHDPLIEAAPPPGPFDVVILCEVMERVPKPVDALFAARDLVAAGGAILIAQTAARDAIVSVHANWWYTAPRNGHIAMYTERTLTLLADRAGLTYYRGAEPHCFGYAKTPPGAELAAALRAFGAPVRALRLLAVRAELIGQPDFHDVEFVRNRYFRWTAATRIDWPIEPFDIGHTAVEIPYLMEMEPEFAARCRILVDGQPVATIHQPGARGSGSLRAEIGPSALPRRVTLQTPEPVRPRTVNGYPDDRLLGIALPIEI